MSYGSFGVSGVSPGIEYDVAAAGTLTKMVLPSGVKENPYPGGTRTMGPVVVVT